MPAAKRLLEENGISAEEVEATGPGGRLLKEDVQKYLDQQGDKQTSQQKQKSQQKEAPKKDKQEKKAPAQSTGDREEEAVAMSPLRRRIAERLVEAQQNAALLTTFNEIDMSEVMALRNEYKEAFTERYEGVRLGFMSFFVKAVIDALKQFPQLNAEIQGTDIVYKNYYGHRRGGLLEKRVARTDRSQRRQDELCGIRGDHQRLRQTAPRTTRFRPKSCKGAPSLFRTAACSAP